MRFFQMQKAVSHLLPKIYQHPFNVALFEGTLPRDKFKLFIEQDALYLRDFAKALRITASRFSNNQHAKQFRYFAQEIIETEQNLHSKYLGVPQSPSLFCSKQVEREKIPVVQAYTRHLLSAAYSSSIQEAVASFIPCFWIYGELGKCALQHDSNHPYQAWISSYSNSQFISAGKSIIKIAEDLAQALPCPIEEKRAISAFTKSTKYELLLWDDVFKKQKAQPKPKSVTMEKI